MSNKTWSLRYNIEIIQLSPEKVFWDLKVSLDNKLQSRTCQRRYLNDINTLSAHSVAVISVTLELRAEHIKCLDPSSLNLLSRDAEGSLGFQFLNLLIMTL